MSDAPIASVHGNPALFATLGAYFHLEPFETDDVSRLERFNEMVLDWFGGELHQSNLSVHGEVTPFHAEDVEFISEHARQTCREGGAPSVAESFFGNMRRGTLREFSLACNGGTKPLHASPFKYSFVSDIPEVADETGNFQALAVLHVSVPASWPTDDFAARVDALAKVVRLRWGVAGYTYSTWFVSESEMSANALYAHARRYPGFDVGYHAANLEKFFGRLRTVSWITYVGASLKTELERDGRVITTSGAATASGFQDGIRIKAGQAPEAGDNNRLVVPAAYRDADQLVRPIRLDRAEDMYWPGRWERSTIDEWLGRFE